MHDEPIPWREGETESPDSTPWQIGFDVESEKGDFVLLDEAAEANERIFPLRLILDDDAYDNWRTGDLSKEHKNRARAIRSAFVDYMIPVVPLATEELAPVTLTFKRVNSGGTKMGNFDMVRALSWESDFDLEKKLDEDIIPRLVPLGWGDLDKDILLKIIATAFGMSPGDIEWERLSEKIKETPAKLADVSKSLSWSISLLREIGFCGPKTLPYYYLLIFATRVHLKGTELSEGNRVILKKWLMEMAARERFGVASPHIINALWTELEGVLKGRELKKQPTFGKEELTSPLGQDSWRLS